MSEHDHDLALAIHHQIISPESVDAALDYWHEMLRQPERIERTARDLLWTLLACTSGAAIDAVLARRLSEAARTGCSKAESQMNAERLAEIGAGAIRTMLGMIGEADATDGEVARILVGNEMAIRAFLAARDPSRGDAP